MPRPRVYVETTIPSFFHETRTAADIVARREWTRLWWRVASERYQLVTSPAVLDELQGGPPEWSAERLALVRGLPPLRVEFGHIRRVNTMLGLFVPTLVTPLELLRGSDEPAAD